MARDNVQSIRTRRNALAMPKWDPALLWYARAVTTMKARGAGDPTSWIFQAAIHGFTLNPAYGGSRYWVKWTSGQALPTREQQETFWGQCQHGTWYFLPWHRMYLGYFEKIVSGTIVGLGGPSDWSLPYWNYDSGKASWVLPTAFSDPKLPDGSDNGLYEPLRRHGNNGSVFLDADDVSTAQAFGDHRFASATPGGSPGFGGPATNFEHSGSVHGDLESSPHDNVHGALGGLMGDPVTASYDPIFWLHHANIDRLWDVWLRGDPANSNPSPGSPWQSLTFDFNDGAGNSVSLAPKQVLATASPPFHYQYDDYTTGRPPAASVAAPKVALSLMAEESIPEMVGASSSVTPLGAGDKTVKVRLFSPSGPQRLLAGARVKPRQTFLHVENVRGKGQPTSYKVYFDIIAGAGKALESLYVGTVPTFGVEHASVATDRHPGHGLTFTFNVSELIERLKASNQWNPAELNVTFVPKRENPEGAALEVGRVSLYYA